MTSRLVMLAAAFSLLSFGPGVSADVHSRLAGHAWYDDLLDVTYLADPHLAVTEDFGVQLSPNGRATFAEAAQYMAGMNAANYLGHANWRLPSTVQPDPTCQFGVVDPVEQARGWGCAGSDLGHMFHVILLATPQQSANATGDPVQLAKFAGIQEDARYWSSTPYPPQPTSIYTFWFANGQQFSGTQQTALHIWPVTDGDPFLNAADDDADGFPNVVDNCTQHANPAQRDSNGDGFGNACDPDLNDDNVVNAIDLGLFRLVFFTADADADFNGDGIVNAQDLGVMRGFFFGPPGPSATAP